MRSIVTMVATVTIVAPARADDQPAEPAAAPPVEVDNTIAKGYSPLDWNDEAQWREGNFEITLRGGLGEGRDRVAEVDSDRRVHTARGTLSFYLDSTIVLGIDVVVDRGADTLAITPYVAPVWELSHRLFVRPSLGFGPELGDHTALRVRLDTQLWWFVTRRLAFHLGPEIAAAVGYTMSAGNRVTFIHGGATLVGGIGLVL